MVSIEGLAVEFSGTTLFSDISFQINEKDRIALMGKNGAGKSTLLKILAGVRQPTRGKVTAPKDCVIAYLPQHLMTEDGRTVYEETAQAFAHLHEMEREIERLNLELAQRTDYESDEYMALIEKVSDMSEKFYAIDLTHFEEDIEKTLLGLGFERSDFQRPTSDFSGGWRMRIELAKLLLKNPDVLLLDEPTNHLDITSKEILEEALKSYTGTVFFVSHDRYFINQTATRILELTGETVVNYIGNYDYYLEKHDQMVALYVKKPEDEAQTEASVKETAQKVDWQTQKAEQARIRKIENALKKAEEKISELEEKIASIDAECAKPEVAVNSAKLGELTKQQSEYQEELEKQYEVWEALSMELDA